MIWSQLKKRVEALFAPEVRGRVELRATNYRGAPDQYGRGYITVDGAEVINMDDYTFMAEEWKSSNAIQRETGLPAVDAQKLAWDELDRRGIYSQNSFYFSLESYLQSSIEHSLTANDVLMRALAVLDRRVGKRRLAAINIAGEHPLVQRLYEVRRGSRSR